MNAQKKPSLSAGRPSARKAAAVSMEDQPKLVRINLDVSEAQRQKMA